LGQYDIVAKDIFSSLSDDIASYFLGFKYIKLDELNIEFTTVEKRESDLIFKCSTDKGNIVLHMEFQTYNDNQMVYRMLRYTTEIMEKHKLMPYQVVVYLGKNELKMENRLYYNFGEENLLNYRYKIIDVGKIKFENIAETNYYDLYALLPLADKERRKREKEKYLRKCVEVINNMPIDIEKKGNIATEAKILSNIVYNEKVIEKIFSEVMNMSILEESKIYKQILAKGEKEGIEKGEKKAKIAIAKELLKKGMGIDEIAEITKLPKEDINKLLN
jgi:predicted transposase/invertase (TIGR01784 family)